MKSTPSLTLKSLTRSLRWALVMASVLALITGFQLFVLTEQTDRYFSWTITSPLTAAFLGAAYWGNTIMFFLASRLFPKLSEFACFVFRPGQYRQEKALTDELETLSPGFVCIF